MSQEAFDCFIMDLVLKDKIVYALTDVNKLEQTWAHTHTHTHTHIHINNTDRIYIGDPLLFDVHELLLGQLHV